MANGLFIASASDDGGIYRFDWDNGQLRKTDFTPLPRTMFLAADGESMYAVATLEGQDGIMVRYSLTDGKLGAPEKPQSTRGKVPCHICAQGGEAYAVNYISGSVISFPQNKLVVHEGRGENPVRQNAAHTHMACFSPRARRVFVTDLGLDSVFVYDRALEFVSSARVPSGYGARHLALSPDGKHVYCVNELVCSVSVFYYERGVLECLHTAMMPVDEKCQNTAAAIRLTSDGKTLFVSVRGEDTIARFKVDGARVEYLDKVDCHGKFPRDFVLSPDEKYLVCCNQYSDDLTVFSLNGGSPEYAYSVSNIPQPLCALFL